MFDMNHLCRTVWNRLINFVSGCLALRETKQYDFYLAGGMRGYPDLNKPMFTLVARLLRERGFTVWSPSEHESYLELSFAKCMTLDLNAVINKCHKIALLPNWQKSLGANMEAFSAFACGKKAVEVMFGEEQTDFLLIHVRLDQYRLPYQGGEIQRFDPHLITSS